MLHPFKWLFQRLNDYRAQQGLRDEVGRYGDYTEDLPTDLTYGRSLASDQGGKLEVDHRLSINVEGMHDPEVLRREIASCLAGVAQNFTPEKIESIARGIAAATKEQSRPNAIHQPEKARRLS